ncbi:hypothetical protein ES705_37217 [subsurface metagenome]
MKKEMKNKKEEELLKEVKELKKKVEDENTKKEKERWVSNARWMVIGLVMIALAFVLWRCVIAIGS